ncbi:MAG: M20/M25/M40 family metallo-hydrolase, partial [Eubacteriales bacterium]|nr:M20/M25/M40 family metallo-hydrolase [Eubacteriales bacterium]
MQKFRADRKRMVSEFISLAEIESLSLKEREMADKLISVIKEMGYEPCEDDAGERAGGNAGNIIFSVPGTISSAPVLLFMAHMDTVGPAADKKIIIDGDVIKTDGSTILGGDDAAGIECLFEALRILKENNVAHGSIQAVFTIAEETGLTGAKLLDYSMIRAKYGFVLDEGGHIGTFAVKAPAQYKIGGYLKGKAAHAGVEPEKGISSIQMASRAVDNMKLGRLDAETTANIGIINGGKATNIVCDKVYIEGECRSRDRSKLEKQRRHMENCFTEAADYYGGVSEIESSLLFDSFEIGDDEKERTGILKRAAAEA